MKRLSLLVAAFFLAGCNAGAPLTFPTATLVPPLETVIGPLATDPPPSATASAPGATAIPADPFAAHFLQLPAPVCSALTPQQTEGPYFKPGSPETRLLRTGGMPGELLIVAGYVLDQNCQPIPGAMLDFWQADANGAYDNRGYTLRGHQFTDEQGRYYLETVVPGEYPGRTEHIHVKLQPPAGSLITSQLYFPDVAANTGDDIFDPGLLVTMESREGFYVAYYNFVVNR